MSEQAPPQNVMVVETVLKRMEWDHIRDDKIFTIRRVKSQTKVFDLKIYAGDTFLLISCLLPIAIPSSKRAAVLEAIDLVNRKMPLGNFETSESDELLYRLGCVIGAEPLREVLFQDLITMALMAIDRFTPLIEATLSPEIPDGNKI